MSMTVGMGHDRLEKLIELCRSLSGATDPAAVVNTFGRLYQQIRPSDYFISLSVRGLDEGTYKITREFDSSVFNDPAFEPPDPWRDWKELPAHSGGFLGDVVRGDEPQVFENLNIADDPVLGDRIAGFRSCVARPIYDDGRSLNWALNFRREPGAYAEADLADALLIANLVGTAARNMLANRENAQLAAALRGQFEQVARVQQSLLPRKLPDIPGVALATSYLTSEEAGGDYYDFFKLPDGRWGMLIADVSGHGAAAATVMAMLHAILHGYEGPDYSPAAVLRYANRRLRSAGMEQRFVTAFLGLYDPESGSLTYARGGHNPPRLKSAGTGRVRPLDGAAAPPLGIFEDYEIGEEACRFEPGDTLVLYTDGVTEAFSPDRRMFGVEGLDATLDHCSGDPDCVIDSVHRALFEHTGRRTRDDDQSLVVMRYLGESGAG